MSVNFAQIDYADGTKTNPGINQYIYMAPVSDILTIQKPASTPTTYAASVTISTAHVMKTGKKFEKIYCIRDKGMLESKGLGGLKMKASESDLKIFIPGTKAELKGFYEFIKNRDLIILAPGRDGEIHQLGTEDLPCSLKEFSWKTGEKAGDDVGAEITFSASGETPYTYAAAVPLTPGS
jgi:hypothetical protein